MIKPLNISPLNTSNRLYCKCEKCGFEMEIMVHVNVDKKGKIIESDFKEFKCEKCGEIIKEN